jgi:hypothetical protein
MDLGVRKETYQGVTDRSWLENEIGIEANTSVVLDISTFVQATHYPNGVILAGTLLGKITASGKYGPYSDAAVDGRQTAVGLLYDDEQVIFRFPDSTASLIVAPLYRRGYVIEANLPANSGVDANGKTDLAPHITFS